MPTPIVKIDGVTVEALIGTLSVSASIGNRAAMNVDIVSTSGAYRPVVGKAIELFESATKLWAGTVDEVEERSISEGQPTGRRYAVRGVSWEQYLDRRYCWNLAAGRPLRYSRNYEYTSDPATDLLTTTVAHGRVNGDKVRVRSHAAGNITVGLSATIEYFVIGVASTTTLKLSLTAGGAAVDITAIGYLEQVLITYRAGEIVALILTEAATSEPLGTTNIALGAVIDTIIFDSDMSCSSAILQLAEASNFAWWIDEERELYFQPRTFTAAPFSISDVSGNYRNFDVRRTREDKCNAALMRVDMEQIGYTSESFVGDGATTKWTLAAGVGEMIRITVNEEDKQFALWMVEQERQYYYELGGAVIRQDASQTTLTATQTLKVTYRKFGATTIYESDATDIAATALLEGNSGIYALPFERPGTGQVQAQNDGRAIIAARKANVAEITYETDQQVEPTCHTLRPGDLQTIANSYHAVTSASYLVRDVSITDVGGRWLKFKVKAIDATKYVGAVEFWKALAGGGGAGGGTAGFSGGATLGSGGGSTNREFTLVANTTIPSPYTPTEADFLTVYITQGAGPFTIAFSAAFYALTPTNLPAQNGQVTVFSFRGRSDNLWWPISAPMIIDI